MKIAFAKPYEDCIDQKATLSIMRKHLLFLARYAYLLEMQEVTEVMVEEESLLNYLPYTKSIIDVQGKSSLSQSTKVILAMEKYDKQREQKRREREERRLRCLWLMQGILVLPEVERKALLHKYVQHLSHEQITHQMDISMSTLHRILKRACIDLAQILEIEVLKKD